MDDHSDVKPVILNDGRHCLADTVKRVQVNRALQLTPYSGKIIPTTKEAVQAIKMTTDLNNINVFNGSTLKFAGRTLPQNIEIKKHSLVVLDRNVECANVTVSQHSQIHLATGSKVTNTTFMQSRTGKFASKHDHAPFMLQAAKLRTHNAAFYNTNLDSIVAQDACLFDCTVTDSTLKNTDITHVNLHTLNKVMADPTYAANDYNYVEHAILNNTRIASEAAVVINNATVTDSTLLLKHNPLVIEDSTLNKSYILNNNPAPTAAEPDKPNVLWQSHADHLIADQVVQLLHTQLSAPGMKPVITQQMLCLQNQHLRYDYPVCLNSQSGHFNDFTVKELKPNYLYNQLISYNENKQVKGTRFADGLDKVHDEKFNNFTKIANNMAIIAEVLDHTKVPAKQSQNEPELEW